MRRFLAAGAVLAGTAGLWLGTASCGKGSAVPRPEESNLSAGRDPEFPADLGPDSIDVTSYPAVQQENYALFVAKCSRCHSLARAVNSPLVDASSWTRFVRRMHGKNQALAGAGPLLSGEEAKRVISFLAFDSRERKIRRAEEFQTLQSHLHARFDQFLRDRWEKKTKESRSISREYYPTDR